jgi:antitoxin YefM
VVIAMDAVSYSNFRQNLKSYMQRLKDDADTVIVTAKDPEDNMVIMNQRDYDSMQETMRIMSNPYLVDKIRRGQKEFEAGKGTIHDLVEVPEDD